MIACSALYMDEGSKFQIHLAYSLDNTTYQTIHYGDLVYITQQNMVVTINMAHKSQTSGQKEAALLPIQTQLLPSQIFVITPCEKNTEKILSFNETTIKQASKIRFVNISTNFSLHSHGHIYKQQEFADFKEVTGFCERDDNDDWFLYLDPSNLIDGFPVIIPRTISNVHHLDKVIIRNAMMGTVLSSHNIMYKTKNQEVITNNKYPREQNDYWELIIYKKVQNSRTSQAISHLSNKSCFCLLHVRTNKMLTYIKGNKYSDGTLEVCCSEGQIQFDEWEIQQIGQQGNSQFVSCNQYFLIKHTNTNQYLCSIDQSSSITKTAFKVFLSEKILNASIWTFESVLTEYND